MPSNKRRDHRTYKMVDSRGRTTKYGITNDLNQREIRSGSKTSV